VPFWFIPGDNSNRKVRRSEKKDEKRMWIFYGAVLTAIVVGLALIIFGVVDLTDPSNIK
jgi:hypothetical protein